jgi:hypothetical protein
MRYTSCLMRRCRPALAAAASLLGIAGLSPGSTIDLATPLGARDAAGEPVSATAVVQTAADSVTVTLENLIVNQRSIGQNLSDFGFQLSGGTTATLTGSSGTERTVGKHGSFTTGGTVATGWELDPTTTGFIHLDVGGPQEAPQHSILGQPGAGGTYANANASIAGNKPHNPYLAGPVTFSLSVSGVTADTTVSGAFFSFGTEPGDNVFVNQPAAVPLPSSALGSAVLAGLVAVGAARRTRRHGR